MAERDDKGWTKGNNGWITKFDYKNQPNQQTFEKPWFWIINHNVCAFVGQFFLQQSQGCWASFNGFFSWALCLLFIYVYLLHQCRGCWTEVFVSFHSWAVWALSSEQSEEGWWPVASIGQFDFRLLILINRWTFLLLVCWVNNVDIGIQEVNKSKMQNQIMQNITGC